MKVYTLRTALRLPIALDAAWAFFSNPKNLAEITPPAMRLRFLTTPPAEVRPGLLLTYRVRPMFAASVTWVTEITDVEAPARFSDRQRRGPFAMWEHEHRFRAVPGGVEVLDEIRYALPFGPLGTWAQPTLVAPQFAQLFAFRRATLAARFGVLT